MLFPTFTYVAFLALVVILRWAVPRLALPMLLASSYAFYMSWGPVYGLLLSAVTVSVWLLGLAIDRWRDHAKAWMIAGVVLCLGVLAFFKYTGFLIAEFHRLFGPEGTAPPRWDVVLPLGISFFTFQGVCYVVDVYHQGVPAERSLARFALFKAFFPQLIAGPIVRAGEFLPQIGGRDHQKRGRLADFDAAAFASGVDLVLRGLVKKVVIADRLAEFSDRVFAHPADHGTWLTWVGVLCYAGQIYGDFSGYTDIARGSARMLGFELPENFRLPYLSGSITEFWRRWHMTLSRWLRDYLYIPLGGNRHGKARQNLNLVITMGLGGLWHGAGWTFVIWGLYHGLLLMLHKGWLWLTGRTPLQRYRHGWPWRVVATASTFVLVCLGWVLFRAPDAATGFTVLGNLFGAGDGAGVPPASLMRWTYGALGMLAAAHALGGSDAAHRAWDRLTTSPRLAPVRGLAWAAAVGALWLLAAKPAEFIYFQF